MPPGVGVSGLESDGGDRFFCGGGSSGKVRAVRRPRRDPAVNESYWSPKLRRNVERDRAADAALSAAGWRVVRVWEHQSLDEAVAMVVEVLKP